MSTPWKIRIFVEESAFACLAFTVAIYVYFLTANWGIQDYLVEGPVKDYLTHPAVHVEHLAAGVMLGVLVGVVNRLTDTRWLRSKAFAVVVLIRTGLYAVGLALVVPSVALLLVVGTFLPAEEVVVFLRSLSLRYVASIAVWVVLVSTGINFLLELRRMVGQGNLWRLLTGHYRSPRDENRVFLFMDLMASTTTAEELGHKRFSELVQECFKDLTMVALKYHASIYQYVGDEVVMSWPAKRPESRLYSVQAFFAYERALKEKTDWYLERFGVVPVFRGGIDVGSVTATEVGELKRDIAYHGDVLNTASRLLDLCKERGERLLVSDRVGEEAVVDPAVHSSWREVVVMKGKREETAVYSLEPSGEREAGETQPHPSDGGLR